MLAAVDVHRPLEPVLDRLVPWARRLGATLDLAAAPQHVTDEGDLLGDVAARRTESEQAALEAGLAHLPAELRGAVVLRTGPLAETLHAAAAGYDLLGVVTHQRTGLSRLLQGSVAAQLVRGSPVPVLVLGLGDPVPDPAEALYVLAPVDGQDVGALPWLSSHLPLHRTELAHVKGAGTPLRPDLAALAGEAGFPGVPLHVVEASRPVGDELVSLAGRLGVDLIVMPSHGRTGLARLVLGSVAERVAEHAHCAVLVVPRPLL